MAIFKCKICGDTIEVEEGATIGLCDSYGSKQTFPRLGGDKMKAILSSAILQAS
jgi:hypothetical protein